MPTNHTHVVLRAAAGVKKVAAQLGYDRFRVLVATDDPVALEIFEHTDLDVSRTVAARAGKGWRPPAGAGIVFSSWRVKEVDKDKSVAAQKEMTGSADACLRNSADMLIDSLLLGCAGARAARAVDAAAGAAFSAVAFVFAVKDTFAAAPTSQPKTAASASVVRRRNLGSKGHVTSAASLRVDDSTA
ncbi:hypothetical protein JL720_13772 [Aureococcus anophagefferens]|nr:hypothetical protein JL720_13772 [Aureococcus anophagefferens]